MLTARKKMSVSGALLFALMGDPSRTEAAGLAKPKVMQVMQIRWPAMIQEGLRARADVRDAGELALTITVNNNGLLEATLRDPEVTGEPTTWPEVCPACDLERLGQSIERAARSVREKHYREHPADRGRTVGLQGIEWPKEVQQGLQELAREELTALPEGPALAAGPAGCAAESCWDQRLRSESGDALLTATVGLREVEVRVMVMDGGAPREWRRQESCAARCSLAELRPLLRDAARRALRQWQGALALTAPSLAPTPPPPFHAAWVAGAWTMTGLSLAATITLFALDSASTERYQFLQADHDARCTSPPCRWDLRPHGIWTGVVAASSALTASVLTVLFFQRKRSGDGRSPSLSVAPPLPR